MLLTTLTFPLTAALILILSLLFVMQMFFRPVFRKALPYAFWACVCAVFGWMTYLSWAKAAAMRESGVFAHLVPPEGSMEFIVHYAGFRLFAPYLIALCFAGVFFVVARVARGRLLEKEEPLAGALGIFVSGWPGLLIYGTAALVITVCISVVRRIKNTPLSGDGAGGLLFSFLYTWIPAAILSILITEWLLAATGLDVLILSQTF